MNVIMFKAQGQNLLMKVEVPDSQLDELKKDIGLEVSLKASEAYMTYDDQGGITVTLIFKGREGVNN